MKKIVDPSTADTPRFRLFESGNHVCWREIEKAEVIRDVGHHFSGFVRSDAQIDVSTTEGGKHFSQGMGTGETAVLFQTLAQVRFAQSFDQCGGILISFHRASRSARMAFRMDSLVIRLASAGENIRKPSLVRTGTAKGASLVSAGTSSTRTIRLPSISAW
jgi:hypothetical protein